LKNGIPQETVTEFADRCRECGAKYGKLLKQKPCKDWYDVPSDEMTLEQARQAVKDLRKKLAEHLEQEPCGDVISRQAVINQIFYSTDNNGDVVLGSTLRERIARLPSVAPQEPKTGYWITKEAYSEDKAMGFTEQIVCSNCDMQNSYFSEWDECKNPISKTFIRSKFCPNCGCRMFEPQESEDKDADSN